MTDPHEYSDAEEAVASSGEPDVTDQAVIDVDAVPDAEVTTEGADVTAEGAEVTAEGAEVTPEPEADGAQEPPAAPVEAQPSEDLAAALAEAERSRDEYLDHLRRERAEFENFRRRSTRERMDALDRGAEQMVASLLGVLDNFGFALEAAEDRDAGDQLAKGVQMVYTELIGVLKRSGLEPVPGAGAAFDPNHHEAMLQVEAEEPVDEPVVVEVLRPGYRFKGRVLRPASVKVAR
ncbi:MAG: nucleotide exchange factor GrpE [Euzebyales bacterium]|nr:nucleotide exchange factor GrpE [Euzebyales bacterium]